ncbi:MAG: magnesium chelatase subunit D [Pseudomonadota bacterium]
MTESATSAEMLPGLAAAVLAVAGPSIGGVVLSGPSGPGRDAWLQGLLQHLDPARPWIRVPISVTDERLLGGLDLGATLSSGKPVFSSGLLAQADGGLLELRMAERQSPATCAAVAAVLDEGCVRVERDGLTRVEPARFTVAALDEAVEDDAPLDLALRDRLGLTIETAQLGDGPLLSGFDAEDCRVARARMAQVAVADADYDRVCSTSDALGISSPRAALQTIAAARALAALGGAGHVDDTALATATLLVLVLRIPGALEMLGAEPPAEDAPDMPEDAAPEPPSGSPESAPDAQQNDSVADGQRPDTVDDADTASLPSGLLASLAQLAASQRQRVPAGRAGARARARHRGRPIGNRAGLPVDGNRLDVPATLKAAAPLQRLRQRRATAPVAVRADDLRVRVFQQKRSTTTLFVVDASGSAAIQRLAETKGAVELLLAECYVRRDQVALIAFRNEHAELLLPPTRSLVRAKRALSSLPGGGATPLAHGLAMARDVSDACSERGEQPLIVVMTDARANVDLDGVRGGPDAFEQALAIARDIATRGHTVLSIDTGRRPGQRAQQLADALQARYLPLPFADAHTVSAAVRGAAA